jgi:crotonobetainyl-CoA:carnitine CoA-transferase CaiB-like acyl-CoA transferase
VWNRSRRSITVDLKSPDGLEAFGRLAERADVIVETFRPGVMDRLGIGYDALHTRNERLVYASCPAFPEGHRLAQRPGYDALVQASSGQQWEQPGWRLGPIFLAMPMPSMGAMFLVPTGILAALIAREETGRGQHVRTSLFQGALLYTTQIWSWIPTQGTPFSGTMMKTYPPGVHQEMIFEVANNEWVHTSVMSGLTPVKSQDEIIGVEEASDPMRYMMLSAEERALITPKRKARYKERERDGLIDEFRANNHAVEAIVSMEESLGASGKPHPQLVANDMIVTIDDPDYGETTQIGVPIHLDATPGAIKGPRPAAGAHNEEIFGALGYSKEQIAGFNEVSEVA